MASSSHHTNRLVNEKSPYLLQHAHNPVDWYPWCEEAIERARSENKVIFLSVGYSTCHWCHVMEKESFENEDTAKIMNENFINIKVDREERPDVDKLYMTFIVLVNGSGGWPMSVFLTPDLTPFTGGTYFPPADRWGMPGFPTLLQRISAKWQEDGATIKVTGRNVVQAIRKHLEEKGNSDGADEILTAEARFKHAVKIFKRNYDDVWGGSEGAPKFPEIPKLNFMLHAFTRSEDKDILDIALLQLDRMANGGIHDHIFGGFSRYAVDKKWHVPHFEKMLYDQAQIMGAYANAYKITRKQKYLEIADKIHTYICSDLRNARGGFYSGEDADSYPKSDSKDKIEGAFYAWEYSELEEALDENFKRFKVLGDIHKKSIEIFMHHYAVKEEGNVDASSDPQGHLAGKNIFIVFGSVEDTATRFHTTPENVQKILDIAHEILHEIRSKRPRPHLDTKVICAWNGLLLAGLAKLATIKDAPKRHEYLATAGTLVKFIQSDLYDSQTKKLRRSTYGDEEAGQSIDGFLDDYAFLIKGLIDYYAATLDVDVLRFAKELQEKQNELFWDAEKGGFFYTEADATNLVLRMKEDHDGAEPAGNSVSAYNLVMLRDYFQDESYSDMLVKHFEYFDRVAPFGYVLPEMMTALLIRDAGMAMFLVVGEKSDATEMFDTGRNHHVPGLLVLHVDPKHPELVTRKSTLDFKMVDGKATAYVCERNVCNLPITDAASLADECKRYLLK